jgi:hypothetical protein
MVVLAAIGGRLVDANDNGGGAHGGGGLVAGWLGHIVSQINYFS